MGYMTSKDGFISPNNYKILVTPTYQNQLTNETNLPISLFSIYKWIEFGSARHTIFAVPTTPQYDQSSSKRLKRAS